MPPSTKRQSLKASGTFNSRAAEVVHRLFTQGEFFDPEDMVQLKYETLRALEVDGYSITRAAAEFGLSRPTIYQTQAQFIALGFEGLLPEKRGPQKPHKLTEEIWAHLREVRTSEPDLSAEDLADRVRQRFQISIHPRTIEKALNSRAKKGLQNSA